MSKKLVYWSLGLSIIAALLSIATILVCISCSSNLSMVSIEGFIGVIVALLAIIVTIVLGWQIYNALEIKEKVKIIDELVSNQKQQEHRCDQMIYNAWHHLSYNSAHMSAQDHDYVSAFRLLHNSLCNSLLLDFPINVEKVLFDMQSSVEKITGKSPLHKELWEEIDADHKSILQSSSFDCIQKRYLKIYEAFIAKVHII